MAGPVRLPLQRRARLAVDLERDGRARLDVHALEDLAERARADALHHLPRAINDVASLRVGVGVECDSRSSSGSQGGQRRRRGRVRPKLRNARTESAGESLIALG